MGIAVLIRQPGVDRPLPPVRGAGDSARDLEQPRQVEIADVEVDVNRVDLVDLGQDRAVASRSDEIAGVHQPSIHPAVERGGDPGVVQVELGQISLGLGGAEVGRRGVPLEAPVFDVGPGGRVVLDQVGVAGQLGFGPLQLGPVLQDGGLGLPEVVLVRVLLDDEERLALLDLLPVLEEDLFEIPHHPGDQLDGVDGLGVTGEIQTVGHRLLHGLGNRHLRGRWRLWLRLLLAAGLQGQEHPQHEPGEMAFHSHGHHQSGSRGRDCGSREAGRL